MERNLCNAVIFFYSVLYRFFLRQKPTRPIIAIYYLQDQSCAIDLENGRHTGLQTRLCNPKIDIYVIDVTWPPWKCALSSVLLEIAVTREKEKSKRSIIIIVRASFLRQINERSRSRKPVPRNGCFYRCRGTSLRHRSFLRPEGRHHRHDLMILLL